MKAPWVSACSKASLFFQLLPPRLVRWGFHPSPFGSFFVGLTEKGAVCLFSFANGLKARDHLEAWQKKWPNCDFVRDDPATATVVRHVFESPRSLKILLVGTAFQQAVWRAIAAIPAGQVTTYAALARAIKNPRAVRAVGTACGANPVPILVPCHRIIASDGTLGGFGGGLPLKKALLQVEGALLFPDEP